MATKIKKSSKSSKRAPAKKSFFKNRLAIMFTLLVVLGLVAWGVMRSMAVPSDINLVESTGKTTSATDPRVTRIIDEKGCYYQTVQCVKAPCEPILVCPAATALPTGSIPLGCTTWFDGCNTCSVVNGVATGCTKKGCKTDVSRAYCVAYGPDKPETTSVPTPTPPPVAACTKDAYACPDGTKVGRTGPNCEFVCPSAAPTSTPTPKQDQVTLTNFSASTPCGQSHFKNYQFSCSLGAKHTINNNTCMDLTEAVSRAKELCQTNPK
ncbi:hypothetical protein KBD69_04760 [Candidatus Woesebacteria bacterium]|nr:hypothetical protein [Candidatus Woesebacteria bacterium]